MNWFYCYAIGVTISCCGYRNPAIERGGIRLTMAEYDSRIRCDRINQMLDRLGELLHAPKEAFRYQEGVCAEQDAYHRIVSNLGGGCAVVSANCGQKTAWRFLAGRTLDVVVPNIRLVRGDGRFYNYFHSRWHTPESMAESIHDRISSRIFVDGEGFFGFRFQDVTDISEMTYEGETAYGSLLFLPKGAAVPSVCGITLAHGSRHGDVLFQRSQLKYIRKLLAGVGKPSRHKQDRQGLAFIQEDGAERYRCIGYIPEKYADQFPVKARINGHGKWILTLAEQDVLQVKGRQVCFPRNPIEESREALKAELHICSESDPNQNGLPCFEEYQQFIEMLSQQQHGTSAIFLDLRNSVVENRMNTLETHCRAQRVEPWDVLKIKPDDDRAGAVDGISRIDGCFIVDYTTGKLEFINVIVDGQAVVDGSLASGSRRNSIPCFLANLIQECRDIKAVAFLFSEDGDLTVIRGSELARQLDPKVP